MCDTTLTHILLKCCRGGHYYARHYSKGFLKGRFQPRKRFNKKPVSRLLVVLAEHCTRKKNLEMHAKYSILFPLNPPAKVSSP